MRRHSSKYCKTQIPPEDRPKLLRIGIEIQDPTLSYEEIVKKLREEFGATEVYLRECKDLLAELSDICKSAGLQVKPKRSHRKAREVLTISHGTLKAYAYIEGWHEKQRIVIQGSNHLSYNAASPQEILMVLKTYWGINEGDRIRPTIRSGTRPLPRHSLRPNRRRWEDYFEITDEG